MLTEEQKIKLSETASEKYQLKINSSQIVHILLESFQCNFYFEGETNFITGIVKNFRDFPLRMDFKAPKGSKEREVLDSYLNQGNMDLEFICKLTSGSHTVVTNTLAISSSQFQEMRIKEKLLGPASSVYVNRQQLNLLTGQLYSSLNVFEEYEIPEFQFQQNFVEDFIRQASDQHFHQVPALEALKDLSSFGMDIGQDLQPGNFFYKKIFFLKWELSEEKSF